MLYLKGQGVKQNDQRAGLYLREAADKGSDSARHMLGVMYVHGRGFEPDPLKGMDLMAIAAKNGFKPAQLELGSMYLNEQFVPQDLQKAKHWLCMLERSAGNSGAPFRAGDVGDSYGVNFNCEK